MALDFFLTSTHQQHRKRNLSYLIDAERVTFIKLPTVGKTSEEMQE